MAGSLAGTCGECKEGMGLSDNGVWGYHPLIVSLANTKEVLYLVNRPGNVNSHHESVGWIDRAIDLVKPYAGQVTLRGDTDFSHTAQLDRWDGSGVKFILGLDAHPKLVALADALWAAAWTPLERVPQYEIRTEPRARRERVKKRIVREKGYENIVRVGGDVTEIAYRPSHRQQSYRLVILRKNLSRQRGERALFDEGRSFFYLTNRWELDLPEVIGLANGRCDQENVIGELKHGVNARRMPVDDLVSNGADLVMAALAWNLKARFALRVRTGRGEWDC